MFKIVIGSIIVAAVLAGTCQNPLFTTSIFEKHGLKKPELLAKPAIQKSTVFCPNLAGAQSCCSDRSLHQMETAWNKYENRVRTTFDSVVEKALAHCDHLDKLAGAQAATFEAERADILSQLDIAVDKCQDSIIQYSRGMMCFGCRADASEFVDQNNVYLDENDFGDLKASCSDFIQAHQTFAQVSNLHEQKLLKSCQKSTIQLTSDPKSESLTLCTIEKEAAFLTYLNKVADSMKNTYEFEATGLKASYNGAKVSVCDKKGCEQAEISPDAVVEFDGLLENKYTDLSKAAAPVHVRLATRSCSFKGKDENDDDCYESVVRGSVQGVFVDVDSFFTQKAVETLVAFSEENGYAPVSSMRQQNQNVTLTLQSKLANASSSVGNYFQSATYLVVPMILAAYALLN